MRQHTALCLGRKCRAVSSQKVFRFKVTRVARQKDPSDRYCCDEGWACSKSCCLLHQQNRRVCIKPQPCSLCDDRESHRTPQKANDSLQYNCLSERKVLKALELKRMSPALSEDRGSSLNTQRHVYNSR